MEKQMDTMHHGAEDVEEPVLLDEQTCLDIRIPAHLVDEPDEDRVSSQ